MADAIPIWIHPVHEVLASVSLPELLWIYNICSKAKSGHFLKSHQSSGCIAVWHTQFYFATRMLFWSFWHIVVSAFFILLRPHSSFHLALSAAQSFSLHLSLSLLPCLLLTHQTSSVCQWYCPCVDAVTARTKGNICYKKGPGWLLDLAFNKMQEHLTINMFAAKMTKHLLLTHMCTRTHQPPR